MDKQIRLDDKQLEKIISAIKDSTSGLFWIALWLFIIMLGGA